MHYVYVIQHNIDKGLYIGITGNLDQRLLQHNTGKNISTVRKNGKWEYVYFEAYRDRRDAVTREIRLKKHGSGKHELYKRLVNSKI
jgi:putative endonuclease